jgi:hypothetical protein
LPGLPYDIVVREYYEGQDYLAIHETSGDTTRLDALPVIAPNRARLLVASAGLDAGYAPNRVTIYRIEPARLRQEWQLETADYVANTGWAADSARWQDSLSIEAIRLVPSNLGATRAGHVRILRTAGAWQVQIARTPNGR